MSTPHRIWPPDPGHAPAVAATTVLPPPLAAEAARWGMLQARDVMRADVVTVDASLPLADVERILCDRRIGGAPVKDASGRIVGIVSLRDLLRRRAEGAPDFDADLDGFPRVARSAADAVAGLRPAIAADVMSPEVHWVDAGASLGEIARTMVTQRVHRLLVRDAERYVGILGTLDVLDALAG